MSSRTTTGTDTFSETQRAAMQERAAQDSGLWPTAFAVKRLSDEAVRTITDLVRKAVG